MGRARRQIYSGRVYEICLRTKRDDKVILCHHLWMGNHPHIIVLAKDKKACTQFYGEVQKQLTEAVKRLLGLEYLNLWMKCFRVEDTEGVKEVNDQITKLHIGLEKEAREERKTKKVMGKQKLKEKEPDLSYRSKKKSRRIFVYSLDTNLRMELIRLYNEFCEQCRYCYEQWKLGYLSIVWPAGALLPPVPHLANEFTPDVNSVY